jgi:chemotaxis protein CheD
MIGSDTATVTAASVPSQDAEHIAVRMGLAALACAPARLTAVVGSCIGVTMYSPKLRLGMLSHVVLPHAKGHTSYPAKYADTAVNHMRSVLESRGVRAGKLMAKIVGGACMFGDGVSMQIGRANVQAAAAALKAAGIRIAGTDVGGTIGRRLSFDLATGEVAVESVGRGPHTIWQTI